MVTRVPRSESGSGATVRGADGGPRPPGVDTPWGDAQWAGLRRAWRAFGIRIPRLSNEVARYAATRIDLARLAASRVAERWVVGVLTFVAIAAMLATGAALAIVGVAGGVATALDGNAWAGNLVTGAGVLVLLGTYLAISRSGKRAARLQRLHDRYARFDRANLDRATGEVPDEQRS